MVDFTRDPYIDPTDPLTVMFDSVVQGRPGATGAVRRLARQHGTSEYTVLRSCAERGLDPRVDSVVLHRQVRAAAEINRAAARAASAEALARAGVA